MSKHEKEFNFKICDGLNPIIKTKTTAKKFKSILEELEDKYR